MGIGKINIQRKIMPTMDEVNAQWGPLAIGKYRVALTGSVKPALPGELNEYLKLINAYAQKSSESTSDLPNIPKKIGEELGGFTNLVKSVFLPLLQNKEPE